MEGNSSIKIAEILKADSIKTLTGKDAWQPSVIDKMLRNEKYMGDALLQKTYTIDFLSKKRVKNQGIVMEQRVAYNE